jgi:protein dithiol oxidoreductase (disulfide-forming)
MISRVSRMFGWLAASVFGFAILAGTTAAQPVAGKDYQVLKPAQPVATGKNIEVLDFFWYGCGGCNQLQAPLYAWLKRKPADVTLRRQPAAFQDNWLQLARTYYTIEAVEAVDKLHPEVFDAIHKTKVLNPTTLAKDPKTLFDWVATKGIDRQKFESAYKSFGVASRTQRTIDLTSTYNISSTPTLVIDGRFTITPQGSYDQFFRNVDQLIDMARKSRGGK